MAYLLVDDVDSVHGAWVRCMVHGELVARDVAVDLEPTDQPWGNRAMYVGSQWQRLVREVEVMVPVDCRQPGDALRYAEQEDGWHLLALTVDDIEKGFAADRSGTGRLSGLAGRGGVRDVRRVQRLGAEGMTFDLPRAGAAAVTCATKRLAGEG